MGENMMKRYSLLNFKNDIEEMLAICSIDLIEISEGKEKQATADQIQ